MNSNIFICELSKENQSKIQQLVTEYLSKEGYEKKVIQRTIENVMSGRLWIIQEIVDINQFLSEGKVIDINNFKIRRGI
ncbi:hypothetical protein [Clostridium hydrogeniformans]|uniref:hypothetical protein n=1 Tax=Clostridium hydrogeniformans TaxID=349933 RepID=UPI0004849602|nr:hypothetical protein [Clostridium hydrogeniformans]